MKNQPYERHITEPTKRNYWPGGHDTALEYFWWEWLGPALFLAAVVGPVWLAWNGGLDFILDKLFRYIGVMP